MIPPEISHCYEEPESFSFIPNAQSTNSGATRIQASETLTLCNWIWTASWITKQNTKPNYSKHMYPSMHMMRNQRGSRNNHRQIHNKPKTMPYASLSASQSRLKLFTKTCTSHKISQRKDVKFTLKSPNQQQWKQ